MSAMKAIYEAAAEANQFCEAASAVGMSSEHMQRAEEKAREFVEQGGNVTRFEDMQQFVSSFHSRD